MSAKNISLGWLGSWWVGLTTLLNSCAGFLGIGEPETPGTLRALSRLIQGKFLFFFFLLGRSFVMYYGRF
jgi:hypothetical protein